MKLTIKLLVLFFGVLMLSTAAYAASPREQLRQMVEQLQKNPTDNALREKIIKLAQTIKPAPAVPEEAERRMVRGAAAFKGAKAVTDYLAAAKEFEQATLAAPWYGDAYFNLGVAQDKAENYEAALQSLKLALQTSPNSKDIKQLIYEVEYHNDKATTAIAAARKEQEDFANFLSRLNGVHFTNYDNWFVMHLDVRNGVLIYYSTDKNTKGMEHSKGNITGYRYSYERVGTDANTCSYGKTVKAVYEFSRDG